MWRIKERIASFMYGRYGNDTFNTALLVLYLIVAVVNVIVRNVFAVRIFFFLQWAILGIVIYRSLSRKISARHSENEWFKRNFKGAIDWFKLTVRRIKDIKHKRYRRCPNCKAVLRLPKRKGTHFAKCPSCRANIKVNIII